MSAIMSDDDKYRYVLRRSLGSILRWYKPMLFIMLNPSTADATNDDPTIRRCMALAKREGATHLTVVNLFALRTSDPKQLTMVKDPIGPYNDQHIREQVCEHRLMPTVAAWGAYPFARDRAKQVMTMIQDLHCFGKTKDGSPRHPLYVKSDVPLIELN